MNLGRPMTVCLSSPSPGGLSGLFRVGPGYDGVGTTAYGFPGRRWDNPEAGPAAVFPGRRRGEYSAEQGLISRR